MCECKPNHSITIVQDTCASMMDVGLMVLKRTNHTIESEPMILNNGTPGFALNQMYTVPLHRNNKKYDTVKTGLAHIQPDKFYTEVFPWLNTFFDPRFPKAEDPDTNVAWSFNGCPLSTSAHRTYFLSEGDYFLQTTGIDPGFSCSNFDVKMECSGGGKTLSPDDSDPMGFSVDANTGAITGTPQMSRNGTYKMELRAVDAADVLTVVAEWEFDVEDPPEFGLKASTLWT